MTTRRPLVIVSGSAQEIPAGDTFPQDLSLNTSNLLTVGEETFSRELANTNTGTATTGILKLSYFTARKTETTTQARIITGATAAAATPTICRIGLYSIATNGDGTLVASTANDTTLFSAASTAYTKSWSVSYSKIIGQRYALGHIVVSGAATPTWFGQSLTAATGPRAEYGTDPRIVAALGSQSDLPSSYTAASLNTNVDSRTYAAILP